MNLEELIYKRLSEAKNLTKYLTRYAGQPAIFTPEAPGDRESGWGRATQYPRAVFNFDMQADGERKSAGSLSVTLICRNDSEAVPELIEPAVKKALKDVLLKDDNGTLYAFAWARTEGFSMTEEKNELLIGSDVRFDIMEYPLQETTDPDPIMAMARTASWWELIRWQMKPKLRKKPRFFTAVLPKSRSWRKPTRLSG